jgi:hypothetical protein
MEFKTKVHLEFKKNMFRSTFIHLAHLLARGPSTWFLNTFEIYLTQRTSSFSQLFLVCSYVVTRCIPRSIARALGGARLLALAKPSIGIRLIAIGKVLY